MLTYVCTYIHIQTYIHMYIFMRKGAGVMAALVYGCILYLACRQLRFSLYSGAVTTRVLVMVAFLYYPLSSCSVEYPMPYASCLVSCSVVWRCSLQTCLSWCSLLNAAQLVHGFELLQSLLSRVFYIASWDSLSGLCALWDSLSSSLNL